VTDVEDPLFVIRTFSRDTDARLAEAVLDANGIESIIIGDNAAGMLPYLNAMHPIRLAVKESDVEEAQRLLGAS
jgi:putative signal transducing protein